MLNKLTDKEIKERYTDIELICETENEFLKNCNKENNILKNVFRTLNELQDLIEENDLKYEENYTTINNAKLYLNHLIDIIRIVEK